MKIYQKKPEWLKVRKDNSIEFKEINDLVLNQNLHTVCQSARCPNVKDCWNRRTATFMILGEVCSRNCQFCAVPTGKNSPLDMDEPFRVAEAVNKLDLKYVVITSVTRDDLPDGGAGIFASTIFEIKKSSPSCKIELLIPDFKGDNRALDIVLNARPDVLNHNVETIPRLYQTIRPQAGYQRSLDLLKYAKSKGFLTKTGFMVGLGENTDELMILLQELFKIDIDIVTIGQYLQPGKNNAPVYKYYHPDEFKELKKYGELLGIPHIEAGPLIRSSYHADEIVNNLNKPV